ncbi:hypothetical protein OG800_50745 (plasmid) [Streptomyces sp. NBC_00445]|uniref:hypothetical protein n=1 Tax=Streptomyces sp. NBC_00445 TaxID=2975745 RepID=UPI002E240DFB
MTATRFQHFGDRQDDPALDAVYAADREAHRARIMGELDVIAENLTVTLLPPEMRAAGMRFVYEMEEETA